MVLEPFDRAKACVPYLPVLAGCIGETFRAQQFRMDPDHDDFFVIRAIEDSDSSALGQRLGRTPEKIVLQLGSARMLEARHAASLRIDAGHHVLDDTVLARRIHALEDDEQGEACSTRRATPADRSASGHLPREQIPVFVVIAEDGRNARRPLLEVDARALGRRQSRVAIFIRSPVSRTIDVARERLAVPDEYRIRAP